MLMFDSPDNKIKITNKSKYWLYVLSETLWENIHNNFLKKKMYISAYGYKSLVKDDIIIFYIKGGKNKNSGFIAIGQAYNDMQLNDTNIRIFMDKNLNRYIVKLNEVSIFTNLCKFLEMKNTIEEADLKIKSISFATKMFRGDGTFTELTSKKIGIAIVKKIYELELFSIENENDNENNNENDNENENENDNEDEIEDENEHDENEVDKNEDRNSNDNDTEDNNTEDNTEDNEEIEEKENNEDNNEENDKEEDEDPIISNIPVMLLTCDELKKSLSKLKKRENKIEIILKHYNFCKKCDITNNNSHELNMTLNRVEKSTIQIKIDNNYNEVLDSYLSLEPYPKRVCDEYIKIYHMINDQYYRGDILIEFTTKIDVR